MAVIQADKENNIARKRGRPPKMKEKLVSGKLILALAKIPDKKISSNITVKSQSQKRKRATHDSLYENNEVQSAVLMQAEQVQANLAPEFPSMIKIMLPSHVSGGFWLGLPKKFCDEHMPIQDTIIFLEDESGNISETKYLAEKVGLSGGWRGFSIAHNLVEGDVLVFHLVRPHKFKVYIIRVNGSDKIHGALGLLTLDTCKQQMEPENRLSIITEGKGDQYMEHPQMENSEEIQKSRAAACDADLWPAPLSEDLSCEVLDGIKLSESVLDFKDVTSLKDFDILVNGLVINSELSKDLQSKYYELCCSQDSFLHEKLLDGLNCKLIVGVIAETIKIADSINASELSTSSHQFATWEKKLKSFLTLGMNVRFLLHRLNRLVSLATKSKRHKEASLLRENLEEERKNLEAKLAEIKATINRLDSEIETLEVDSANVPRNG